MRFLDLGMNTKIKLMKIDLCMDSIRKINRDIPSLYIIPKNILSEARSALYSDVTKCRNLTIKALKNFQKESAVASKYNLLIERIGKSTDPKVRSIDTKYNEAIRRGDYREADVLVGQLQSCRNLYKEIPDYLTVDLNAHLDGIHVTVSGCGIGKGRITIRSISVVCGGSDLHCNGRCTFTMGPNDRKVLVFNGGRMSGSIHVIVSYFAEGYEKAIDKTIMGAN